MAEQNDETRGATGGRQVTQGASSGQRQSEGGSEQPPSATSNSLRRGMPNLNRQQPAVNLFVINHFFGPVVQGDLHGNIATTTNILDSRVASVGGQSASRNVQVQPPSGMTESELRECQTDALVHLLNGLNLQEFEQPILGALERNNAPVAVQQVDEQGDSHAEIVESPPADIGGPTEAVIKKISNMELGDDIEKLVEEGLIALIRDDDSEKSTLDLINAYNEESASLSTSFYADRQDLIQTISKSWGNFFLELASATFDQHRVDQNEMKRVLARICGVSSKRLQQRNNYDSYKARFISRADDIFTISQDFIRTGKPIHAMLAFYTTADFYKIESLGNSSDKIRSCLQGIVSVLEEMGEQQDRMINHVMPLLIKVHSFILSIENPTNAVRIDHDASRIAFIGFCYYAVGKHQQSWNKSKSAIELMETEFKENAKNYKVYGTSLVLAGAINCDTGNIAKAVEFCSLGLEAYKNAKDWRSDDQKNECIEFANDVLSEVQERARERTSESSSSCQIQ